MGGWIYRCSGSKSHSQIVNLSLARPEENQDLDHPSLGVSIRAERTVLFDTAQCCSFLQMLGRAMILWDISDVFGNFRGKS